MTELFRKAVRRVPALVVLSCIALFVAGAGTALFGFVAIGYDEPLRVTAGAIAAGAVMVAASIALTVATERQLRADEKRALAEHGAAAPKAARKPKRPAVRADAVLGEWTLAPDEWRAFVEQEADRRRRGAWEPALFGAAVGAVVPWIFTGTWRYSLVAAPLLAALVFAGALMSAARSRKRAPRAGGTVVVRRNAVEIDGERDLLRDDEWWLSGARMVTDLPLSVMELVVSTMSYERNGSERPRSSVIRVPVSRAREADAHRICAELKRGVVDMDEV